MVVSFVISFKGTFIEIVIDINRTKFQSSLWYMNKKNSFSVFQHYFVKIIIIQKIV